MFRDKHGNNPPFRTLTAKEKKFSLWHQKTCANLQVVYHWNVSPLGFTKQTVCWNLVLYLLSAGTNLWKHLIYSLMSKLRLWKSLRIYVKSQDSKSPGPKAVRGCLLQILRAQQWGDSWVTLPCNPKCLHSIGWLMMTKPQWPLSCLGLVSAKYGDVTGMTNMDSISGFKLLLSLSDFYFAVREL